MAKNLRKLIGNGAKRLTSALDQVRRGDQPEEPESIPKSKHYKYQEPSGSSRWGLLTINCGKASLIVKDITALMAGHQDRTWLEFPNNAVFRIKGKPEVVFSAIQSGTPVSAIFMDREAKMKLRRKALDQSARTPFTLE